MSKGTTKYDFKAMGQAIKEARLRKGQHPSFQVFITLMTLFHISVDQFLFPDEESKKSTHRRQLDAELDGLDDKDYRKLDCLRRFSFCSGRFGKIALFTVIVVEKET